MKVWTPPISQFGRLAWPHITTGDRRALLGDRSREKGTPIYSLSQVAACGDTGVKHEGKRGTHSQSERQGKSAGRRKTNSRKHRKGTMAEIAGRAMENGYKGEPLFDGRSLVLTGKKMGTSTCEPVGVKGYGMYGKHLRVKSGEDLCGLGETRVRDGIRPDAESHTEAMQGVGDGHSTWDPEDNKTCGEGRPISLESPSMEEVSA